MKNYDIVIVGAGIVGSTAALALSQQTDLKIALIESKMEFPVWDADSYHFRVSAISPASADFFSQLNVWNEIRERRVSPFLKMTIWNARESSSIEFDAKEMREACLGYIVEDCLILNVLHKQLEKRVDFLRSYELKAITKHTDGYQLINHEEEIFTHLLIGADGPRSFVRKQLAIEIEEESYNQTAIVARVKTKLTHEDTARQCFMPTGPLAFLPLEDPHHCSIVWSHNQADFLLSLDDEAFCNALSEAFEYKLGEVVASDKRYSFPLYKRQAKNYIAEHAALIGDAAHTIHPLAGQGLNLGLMDARGLVEVITDTRYKNRQFNGFHTLRKYERARKSANQQMLTLVSSLKSLFESDKKYIRTFRSLGFAGLNYLTPLKTLMANLGMGRG